MNDGIKKICEHYGVNPDEICTGAAHELTDANDPKGHLRALHKRVEASSPENMLKGSIWNFNYTEMAGSDPIIMGKIDEAWKKNLPFGLKCQRSRIVFIPHKLKAHWIWSDDSRGPTFEYKSREEMLTSIRFQYLGHKEFIPTAELAALAKIILYTKAIENVESWERKILSQPGQPTRPLEPGEGGV